MPKSGPKRFYVVSPKEHQAILNDGKIELSWHFKELKPDFDIIFECIPSEVEALSTEKLMEYLKSTGEYHESRYIRYFRNRTYATYGRKFQNPYVRYQFADLPGQNGKTDFRAAHLSPSDKEFLQFLKFIESEEGDGEEN
jgi:catalase